MATRIRIFHPSGHGHRNEITLHGVCAEPLTLMALRMVNDVRSSTARRLRVFEDVAVLKSLVREGILIFGRRSWQRTSTLKSVWVAGQVELWTVSLCALILRRRAQADAWDSALARACDWAHRGGSSPRLQRSPSRSQLSSLVLPLLGRPMDYPVRLCGSSRCSYGLRSLIRLHDTCAPRAQQRARSTRSNRQSGCNNERALRRTHVIANNLGVLVASAPCCVAAAAYLGGDDVCCAMTNVNCMCDEVVKPPGPWRREDRTPATAVDVRMLERHASPASECEWFCAPVRFGLGYSVADSTTS